MTMVDNVVVFLALRVRLHQVFESSLAAVAAGVGLDFTGPDHVGLPGEDEDLERGLLRGGCEGRGAQERKREEGDDAQVHGNCRWVSPKPTDLG